MRAVLIALLALLGSASASAQTNPGFVGRSTDPGALALKAADLNAAFAGKQDYPAAVAATGGTAIRLLSDRATDTIWAPDFGSCTWDVTHDVGPCIAAAIAKAASLGGRVVDIPAGTYGLATPLTQHTSGVKLRGGGIGIRRDTIVPDHWLAVTRLVWIGAAGATMLDVEPALGATVSMHSADVTGIVFDCNSIANVCAKLATVSRSVLDIGASEPRMIGNFLTTTAIADAPGMQGNTISLSSRSTNPAYSPTGVLIDGGEGAGWNVSYNRFLTVSAWYNRGDGIVIGNSDNNEFAELAATANPGATGNPIVFAAPGYVMPNGLASSSIAGYSSWVRHVSGQITVQGYTQSAVIAAGANAGNAGPTTIAATTNAGSAIFTTVGALGFASTAGLASGMSVDCGTPLVSGVSRGNNLALVGSSTVDLAYPTVGAVPIGAICTFSHGFRVSARVGTYTITATGPTTFNVAAPTGGTSQTGVSAAGGVLNFSDLVLPWTGTAVSGDTWTLTVRQPPANLQFERVDRANSMPVPHFAPGSSGSYTTTASPYPISANPTGGISLSSAADSCGGRSPPVGLLAIALGGCVTSAAGQYAVGLGGSGNSASGFGAVAQGNNTTASGTWSYARGISTVASGTGSEAAGQYATDRGDNSSAWGSNAFAAAGEAQTRRLVLAAAIATTSPVQLTTNGLAAGASNGARIPVNTVYHVGMVVSCTDTTARANWATWNLQQGALTRGASNAAYAGDANTATTPSQSGGTMSTATLTIGADTTNNVLAVTVAMPNSNASHCVSRVDSTEVQ